MVSKSDLLEAIEELEGNENPSYSCLAKLADLYTVYDELYRPRWENQYSAKNEVETLIDSHGDSEFFRAIENTKPGDTWAVIGELVEVLRLTNGRLYAGLMRKLNNLKRG